jgi:hypothetical protein
MDFEEEGATFDLVQAEPSQSNVQDIEMDHSRPATPQFQPVSPNLTRSLSPTFDLAQVEPSQSDLQDIEMDHSCPATPQSQPVSPNMTRSPSPTFDLTQVEPSQSNLQDIEMDHSRHSRPAAPQSQPVSPNLSRPPSPADGTPPHSAPSRTKFPTPSRSTSPLTIPIHLKRKGDSLMRDAPKRVETYQPTTNRRSSKTFSARQLPEPTAQACKIRPSRRHESSPTLPFTNSLLPAWYSNSLAMLQNNELPLGNRWA